MSEIPRSWKVSVELDLCQMIEIQRMIEGTLGSWLRNGEFGDERLDFRRKVIAELSDLLEPVVNEGIEYVEARVASEEARALDDDLAVRDWLQRRNDRDETE